MRRLGLILEQASRIGVRFRRLFRFLSFVVLMYTLPNRDTFTIQTIRLSDVMIYLKLTYYLRYSFQYFMWILGEADRERVLFVQLNVIIGF